MLKPVSDMTTPHAIAHHYITTHQWPVFPCRAKDEERIDTRTGQPVVDPETGEIEMLTAKSPYTSKGFRSAAKLPRIIDRWWTDHPDAMIGIPTGEATGVWVLDVDVADGKPGEETLAALLDQYGPLPPTREARTASGGRHIYFTYHPGVRNRGALGRGLDVRGEGGFVIAPGSLLADGRAYEWINDLQPAPAPQWLLDLVLPPPVAATPTNATPYTYQPGNNDRYVEAAVQAELDKLASTPAGERGQAVNASAFSLGTFVGAGVLPRGEAESGLYSAAVANGVVAKDGEREIRAKIKRGLEAGIRQPRHIPEPDHANDNDPGEPWLSAARRFAEIQRQRSAGATATPAAPDPAPAVGDNDEEIGFIDTSEWAGVEVPPREWYIPHLVPGRTVTILSGDGGLGKSLLALQVSAASALGTTTLGLEIQHGKVLYIAAEDEKEEVHRRLDGILDAMQHDYGSLGGRLKLLPLADGDATLALPDKSGLMKPTPLFKWLSEKVVEESPVLLVLDTSADFFGGNEVDRVQVRTFVRMIRTLAQEANCAVLLLSHPSVQGMQTGTGSSGSTAWNNSARSRLYLTSGEGDVRKLQTMKSNYGPRGDAIEFNYDNGIFVLEGEGSSYKESGLFKKTQDSGILELVKTLTRRGIALSPNKGPNYFAKVMFRSQKKSSYKVPDIEEAVHRMIDNGMLDVIEEGPPSKRRKRIIAAEDNFGSKNTA